MATVELPHTAVERMPVELHACPVSLQEAIENLGYALESAEDGKIKDAQLYAERAKSKLLFAQRSVQATVARWQEYNARFDRLMDFVESAGGSEP